MRGAVWSHCVDRLHYFTWHHKERIMVDCISTEGSIPPQSAVRHIICIPHHRCVDAFRRHNFHAANLFSVRVAQAVHNAQTCLYKFQLSVLFLDTTVSFFQQRFSLIIVILWPYCSKCPICLFVGFLNKRRRLLFPTETGKKGNARYANAKTN